MTAGICAHDRGGAPLLIEKTRLYDGSAIPGLSAIGNCSASVMGRTYPGAGGTMGPAMTFAYVLACELIGS